MYHNSINVIGIMSGTSLDGLDLCLVKFNDDDYSKFQIIKGLTYPYSKKWINKLTNSINLSNENLDLLDKEYGKLISDTINKFINECGNPKINLVSSHGHTVFHDPKNGITKQIGNGKIIFDNINTDLVYDFRVQDVKLGGQGAPLVPIGDLNLFKNYKYCLNLGGFSNISIKENDKIIAFDISPVNTVLNHYSKKLGFEYDKNGTLSNKGIVDIDLLKKLNKMKYYELQGPKSLGIEFVIQKVFPLIDSTLVNDYNILRTYIEHIATQLKKAINENNEDKILITGGGAYNKTLIKVLENKLKCHLVIPEKEIIENKEALIFAYLGLLKANNKINCLKSVTGASKNHSSGQIFRKL